MDLNLAKVVPDYMNEDYFNKVIKHIEKDENAKVSKFEVTAGSEPGQNFGSALYRGKITFTSKYAKEGKTISVIIKAQPILGPEMAAWAETIKNSPMFRNEMEVYGKILPEIQSLLLSAGDKDVLSPNLLYQSNDPSPVIILEDVSVHGFGIIKRPPEDFEVSRKIAERLAKFHAATFYLISEHKLDPSQFNKCVFEDAASAELLLGRGLKAFTEIIKDWEGYEKYVEHFEAFKNDYQSKIVKVYKPIQGEFAFNVLNHADFHINNMLFKKNNEDKIEEILFIDYQICNYSSPAVDLIYAMYYFMSNANRQTRRGEFINSYYKQFVTSLKQFGYIKAPPSLIDLQVELLRNGALEVVLAICHSGLFYIDLKSLTPEDMDQGEGTKKFQRKLYNIPEFKEMIQKELPRFLYNGFI